MRTLLLTFPLILILSCSGNHSNQGEKSTQGLKDTLPLVLKEEVINLPDPSPDNTKYSNLDSVIKNDIRALDALYNTTPFFTTLNNRKFYIICSGEYDYRMERFGGTLKYGLANDSLEILLGPVYDKIYNPNLTIKNCFEIKRNSKIGLINYVTGEILAPQFDYILPSANQASDIAYGYKDQKWFEIKESKVSLPLEVTFDPTPVLKSLSFSISNIGENMMFDSYFQYYENDANMGRGVVIVPSYVEFLNLLSDDSYTDVILPDQQLRVDFGTEQARFKTSLQRNITDGLVSFFVSIYESGIDARGYQMESKELVLYHQKSNTINSVHLGELSESDYFCRESGYRFVNDSIIEVESNLPKYRSKSERYDFETKYTYYKISNDGSTNKLSSDRYFDFTKFIFLEEHHFRGCFAWRINDASYTDDYNMWMTDHLSIEDLDIMRNEIFAEYGYKFKSEKWQEYFSSKSWYKPMYDDVNDRLTEIDKANIKLILKVKEKMQENEEKFINKRPTRYVAAG